MEELNNQQLMNILGGTNFFTASFFNAISRAASTLMDIGRSLGSAIRRGVNGTICPI